MMSFSLDPTSGVPAVKRYPGGSMIAGFSIVVI